MICLKKVVFDLRMSSMGMVEQIGTPYKSLILLHMSGKGIDRLDTLLDTCSQLL